MILRDFDDVYSCSGSSTVEAGVWRTSSRDPSEVARHRHTPQIHPSDAVYLLFNPKMRSITRRDPWCWVDVPGHPARVSALNAPNSSCFPRQQHWCAVHVFLGSLWHSARLQHKLHISTKNALSSEICLNVTHAMSTYGKKEQQFTLDYWCRWKQQFFESFAMHLLSKKKNNFVKHYNINANLSILLF